MTRSASRPAFSPNQQGTAALRQLRFRTLDEAVDDAQRLLASGYQRHGNWTLGQICQHLRVVQDPSLDGYPFWMSLFAPLRPLVRRLLLPKILADDSPVGIKTSRIFVPAAEVDDAEEVSLFCESVGRLKAHKGAFYPHPGFGRLDAKMLERVHSAHAAHHLRFLSPTT
ncbi:DUF1569 domain-containing protein [Planctomycetes bacterium TBK1r]|uniref:DUF1569 domain-containing protein n=2 Tax=Stieleria TaxID=2795973 RepID=UPI00119EAECE